MDIIMPIEQQMHAVCMKPYVIRTYELSCMLRR